MLIHNADITGSLTINGIPYNTGSFTGSFFGDGSQLSGVTSYTNADTLAFINSIEVVSGSIETRSTVSDTFTSVTSYTVTHNFDTKEVIVSVYENDTLIFPSSINTPTTNTVTITFPEPVTGRVVVVKAGHIVSGSINYDSVLNKPTLVSGSSQITYSDVTGIPSGIISSSAQIVEYNVFATTGSNQFDGSQVITGSLTVTGEVVAQTLNVQEVTSSIVFSSGSNIFGNDLGNTQQLTGSVSITGSLTVNGSGLVPYTGATADVNLGNFDVLSRYLNAEGSPGLGGVLNIKQDAVYLPKGNGYSSIASSFTAFDFYGYTGASTYKNFSFRFDGLTDNTLRIYTLPNADGTLALTSNLSAYLPLTGGTLTGALNGTSASFTGAVQIVGSGNSEVDVLTISNFEQDDSGDETANIFFQLTRSYTNSLSPAGYIKVGKERAWNVSGGRQSFMSFLTRNGADDPTERMRITSAGNVGIGTASPSTVKPTTTFGWASNLPSRVIEIAPAGSEATGANAGLFLRSSNAAIGFDLWTDNFFGDSYLDTRAIAGFIFRTNTNGTAAERMRISSTGAVTKPSQPAWSVGLSSAQTISSPSIIAWNQSSGNDCFIQGGVTLNGDNGRVTVPVAGKYMLFASIRTEDPGAVTTTNLNIRRNGTNILRHYVGGAVNSAGSYMYIETRPVIVNCAANDYIDFNFDSVPDTFVISATANTVVRFGGFLMG